jgi:hypothetical protein
MASKNAQFDPTRQESAQQQDPNQGQEQTDDLGKQTPTTLFIGNLEKIYRSNIGPRAILTCVAVLSQASFLINFRRPYTYALLLGGYRGDFAGDFTPNTLPTANYKLIISDVTAFTE